MICMGPCGRNLDLDCFYNSGRNGRKRSRCKDCLKEQKANNPNTKEYHRNYKKDHKEQNRLHSANKRKQQPERVKELHRKSRYGLTPEQFKNLLQLQDNKCAICKMVFIKTPRVDHCHSTGKVRGLLCSNCNIGLGMYKDDRYVLSQAIEYLTKFQER